MVENANPFDLLGDTDEVDVQPKAVAPKAKAKEAEKPVPSVAAGVEARLKGNANGPPAGRGGRGEGRGRGGGRGGGRGYDRPARDEDDAPGGGGGERGGGRGSARRGTSKRHAADNDRHDGTGRGHELEKREGGGKGNWGTVGEEIAAQEASLTEDKADDVAEGGEAEAPAVETEPAEPEKEEMTLDEYNKQLEEKRAGLNKKASTEVKTDPKAFEGMKSYTRKDSVDEGDALELSTKKQVGKSKSGSSEKTLKQKEIVATGFRVGTPESAGRGGGRGRGERGGRGGDRGGRGGDRFGDRGGRSGDRGERSGEREDRGGRGDRGDHRGGRGERGGRGDRGERPERDSQPPRRSEGGENGPPRDSRDAGRGGRTPGRGGDRPAGGRGRGRDAIAIDDASAFPSLGGK